MAKLLNRAIVRRFRAASKKANRKSILLLAFIYFFMYTLPAFLGKDAVFSLDGVGGWIHMRLPAGHARRLFLGFTCSIMFLVVFALLIAHNTEAESSSNSSRTAVDDYPLTIGIPTANPELTIKFYRTLGFSITEGISRGLDIVCMEKEGTPYKLEICHDKFSESGPFNGGVSGMSFKVRDLASSVKELSAKGLRFSETEGQRDGVVYASLNDPNGISIKLFEH